MISAKLESVTAANASHLTHVAARSESSQIRFHVSNAIEMCGNTAGGSSSVALAKSSYVKMTSSNINRVASNCSKRTTTASNAISLGSLSV